MNENYRYRVGYRRRQFLTYAAGGAVALLAPWPVVAATKAARDQKAVTDVTETNIRAVAFDSYGTLFDVESLAVLGEKLYPGKGKELSQLWRRKQIEYSWLRTLLKRYRDFEKVTEDGLVFATNKLKLELTPDNRQQLLDQYLRLDAFPDVVAGMQEFRQLGVPLAIVSNGTQKMLQSAVKNAGIESQLDRLVSVDTVKVFKTDPRIYLAGARALNMSPKNICFVSSHSWDVIGAVSVGYVGFWVNRNDEPVEELGVAVANQGKTLIDAARFVKRSRA